MPKALKQYLIDKHGLAADASDDDAQKLLGQLVATGAIDQEKLRELTSTKEQTAAKTLEERLAEKHAELEAKFQKRFDEIIAANDTTPGGAGDDTTAGAASDDVLDQAVKSLMAKLGLEGDDADDDKAAALKAKLAAVEDKDGDDPLMALLVKNASAKDIRGKRASDRYRTTKSAATWSRPGHGRRVGEPVKFYQASMSAPAVSRSVSVDELSELEWAKFGAWTKMLMRPYASLLPGYQFTKNERELVVDSLESDRFWLDSASGNDVELRRLGDAEKARYKAVLDSSTSGGEEAVPEYYDTALFTTPLLHSELLPHVTVINVPRGSGWEGASFGTPTFSNTADGSEHTPFSTTSFVSDFSGSFFVAMCAIEYGLDFLSDAVPGFAQQVAAQISQEALRWIDEQIAIGDGTTEPQGIMQATGTSVSSAGGTGTAPVAGDLFTLLFGIDKAHRNEFGGRDTGFVMNDTTYKRFRDIVVDTSNDQRRVFGVGAVEDYMLLNRPVWIQNDMSNSQAAYANLRAYRLYRRQGLGFTTDVAGSVLRRANLQGVYARMRYGGKIMRAGSVAQMTDLQL